MIGSTEQNRLTTEIEEMDRVLGGGFVQGSMVLLGETRNRKIYFIITSIV